MYHVSFLCVPCLIPTWAMTLSYVCHDSFLCVTWIICMCTMTHIYVYHDSWTISVVLETWSTSKKKRAFVRRDSYLCVCPIIQWLTFMCTMTHIYECDVFPMFVMTHIYQLNASWTRGLKTWFHNKKTWSFERGKGTVHLPMYLRTHTHKHIRIRTRTHTHTHICTHIPPTANKIKIEPESSGSNHSEYWYHRKSQFCWDLRTTHPHIVLKNNCISLTYIYMCWKGCE